MKARIGILLALILVIGLPFLFRPETPVLFSPDDTVVVITPHMESIRHEFGIGFAKWYQEKTGRTVSVDFRVIGGTSEITRFLNSEYNNSFRNYWTGELGRSWSREVEQAFANPRIQPADTPQNDTVEQAARRAFLESNVSSGMDIFFGGGTYDYTVMAERGMLVDGGLFESHPQWFIQTAEPGTIPPAIPQNISGETFYDSKGRWYGAVLSAYGIIYNRDSLANLGITREPAQWAELADPRYFGQLAVTDPTKSGSITQAFEMIVQQQMQQHLAKLQEELPGTPEDERIAIAVSEGWMAGLRLIQRISANGRYFTDSAQKPNIDVAVGDSAAGMSIDFYGRFQQENIEARGGGDRFGFTVPEGGSTISADPIGLLRGARNEATARAFIEYVLSIEGQKLWNFKTGTPGGPEKYALRRPPIRPELYTEEYNHLRSDLNYNPYLQSRSFHYHREWTGALFSELRTIIRIAFIDVRKELVDAWAAIIQAREQGRHADADAAEAIFSNLDKISYHEAMTTIDAALKGPSIEEVRLARDLSEYFRRKYNTVIHVASGKSSK